mmetsp:Transcript_27306/g.88227  ORF Transcript_27306/g.88227 Transcript_27306/m.88227 type:complete len:236 (+) Transcript_27306:234-941(+)
MRSRPRSTDSPCRGTSREKDDSDDNESESESSESKSPRSPRRRRRFFSGPPWDRRVSSALRLCFFFFFFFFSRRRRRFLSPRMGRRSPSLTTLMVSSSKATRTRGGPRSFSTTWTMAASNHAGDPISSSSSGAESARTRAPALRSSFVLLPARRRSLLALCAVSSARSNRTFRRRSDSRVAKRGNCDPPNWVAVKRSSATKAPKLFFADGTKSSSSTYGPSHRHSPRSVERAYRT